MAVLVGRSLGGYPPCDGHQTGAAQVRLPDSSVDVVMPNSVFNL
jgi:hypothetical protein